jgi:hypothetical protein
MLSLYYIHTRNLDLGARNQLHPANCAKIELTNTDIPAKSTLKLLEQQHMPGD